ncbi:MAG: PAS domain S-box protein [Bacteroidota bacterium]|jgi:PAS domain S-box-containing protein|nr:PAS domain S-box protein [Ignavibacteria bacterium]MCU7498669.1 PAS domain S-box protein [Ignavibacteria bacterium]MCU7512582.1 PAS domain S-box protein [Ignavibacteria bacterium]MCU7519219.1 PAS domain S-box protein [Ignavibacteria bacterium]MCU7524360.1 PAS domain S-box protein [Ignavibacteria bacterium]
MELNLQPPTGYNKGSSVIAVLAIAKILVVIIFVIDLYLPLGYAVWILYLIPLIYVSIKLQNPLFTNLILVLCVLLIIAEFFLSRSEGNLRIALFNAVLGIAAFMFVTYILNYKKSLEGKLIESETLFRRTFEQAGTGIVHFDMAGRWIRLNDKYCEIVGHTREELQHMSPSDIIHPNDLEKDLNCRLRLISGEISDFKIEKRYIRRDASIAWTIFTCTLMHEASTNRDFFVGVVEDITKRKLEEETVKASEAFLKQVLELLPVGILFLNEKGEITRSNPKAKDIWGGERRVGIESFADYKGFWPDSGEPIGPHEWASARAIEKGETVTNELVNIVCFGGNPKTIINSAMPLKDDAGRITGAINVIQDITELKKAEEDLRVSEEKFRTIAETMPLIVWTAERTGDLDYANQWGLDYSGMNAEELEGWGWLKMLHPDDLARTEEKWEESLRTGKIYEDTVLFRKHDGHYRWFLTRAVPLRDNKGNIIKWFGTSTDIHEQKKAAERLHEVLKELERSNNELEQFAYVASHDMKEPLRMISSYLQLLSKNYKGKLDENADDFISYAVDGALRMSTLINDLLLYSRVSSKAREFTSVNLKGVVEDVLGDLEVLINESKAVITYKDLPTVKADDLQMKQLFQNLIQNALKFRNSEGIKVDISSERTGSEWLITVRDNGIGIDPQYYERIFVIFQRLHEREKYSGTGIGLALCKKIVERHGGRIWVESEPGKGSSFHFTLPA